MAGTSNNDPFNSQLYLSPNQQDLLLAALNSNNPNAQNMFKGNPGTQDFKQPGGGNFEQAQQFAMDSMNTGYFASPPQETPAASFGGNQFDVDDSPYVDFLDGDTGFDFDNPETDDLMIGSIPGMPGDQSDGSPGDSHDKRKSPEDGAEDGNGSGKRREGEDKTAKKPGRKPLTSEPTTVSALFPCCYICSTVSNASFRSGKRKIELPSALSESGRRSTSRTWRPRSRSSAKPRTPPIMKTACSVPRFKGCRQSFESIESGCRSMPPQDQQTDHRCQLTRFHSCPI
jgi:hypothetical protein